MTTPFSLDKALAGHTVYFRGKPVDEWHYFASAETIVISYSKCVFAFNPDGRSPDYCDALTLGPRIAWAIHNRLVDRLGASVLYSTQEEALSLCSSDETPVQVLLEV